MPTRGDDRRATKPTGIVGESAEWQEVLRKANLVAPTEATINDNSYAPLSRPLFIYPDVGKAKERPELKGFVDFYFENGSALAAEVGYVQLPDDLLQKEKDEWAAAVGG